MTDKLLPCPFCGDTESLYPSYDWPGSGKPHAIDCIRCGFDFTPRAGMDVVGMWNTRASDANKSSLEAIEAAARRLAYIVRKSVNAGPLSKDPTAEGQAWRALRTALGESYDEKGELA